MPSIVPRIDPAAEPWLESMADALACPMLLLHADGRLQRANAAGRELLATRTLLERDERGLVRPVRAGARGAFTAALAGAAAGERRWLTEARDGLSANLAPLAPAGGPPQADGGHRAHMPPLVLLALPPPGLPALDDYAAQHALNEAEARLVAALMRGERLSDIARNQRCSLGAVRHRAAVLRRKTGHASLLGLVHELSRLPPLRR